MKTYQFTLTSLLISIISIFTLSTTALAAPAEDDLTAGGPGVKVNSDQKDSEISEEIKGDSLGTFTTTGYCNCEKCCPAGWTLTYSGTVPKASHTISADITQYPIGTKLMIGDTVYTVEDVGSHVSDNWIDVYYDTHEDAIAHGKQEAEVFSVITQDITS